MKRIVTAITLSCLAGSAFGQSFTPYTNPEEQERFDRITAPFIAGEVPPMDPSNFQHTSECEIAPEAAEWKRQYREDFWPGVNHLINIYLYNRHLNVLEAKDCSCVGKTPSAVHTASLFEALPVDDHTGWKVGSNFYTKKKLPLLNRLVSGFCGGRI